MQTGYDSMIHRREISLLIVIVALGLVLAAMAPGYFARENLSDLLPRQHAGADRRARHDAGDPDRRNRHLGRLACSRSAASSRASLAKARAADAARRRWPRALPARLLGALNGGLVAYLRIPSIVVTLATMVALRDGLRWVTEGAWVQDLPPGFQWFGLPQSAIRSWRARSSSSLLVAIAWGMRHLAAGRAVYATGSNETAARLAGHRHRAR